MIVIGRAVSTILDRQQTGAQPDTVRLYNSRDGEVKSTCGHVLLPVVCKQWTETAIWTNWKQLIAFKLISPSTKYSSNKTYMLFKHYRFRALNSALHVPLFVGGFFPRPNLALFLHPGRMEWTFKWTIKIRWENRKLLSAAGAAVVWFFYCDLINLPESSWLTETSTSANNLAGNSISTVIDFQSSTKSKTPINQCNWSNCDNADTSKALFTAVWSSERAWLMHSIQTDSLRILIIAFRWNKGNSCETVFVLHMCCWMWCLWAGDFSFDTL